MAFAIVKSACGIVAFGHHVSNDGMLAP